MQVPEEQKKKTNSKKGTNALIDPIYQKFTKSVLRALSSTDFYEFFMDSISKADNEFQFSNRKLQKAVDTRWVDEIEKALPAFQNIISSPRNVIREEELVVNAAYAKKIGPDVVRHLSQHASFVEDYNEDSGDVRPTKVMQKYRDDSEELYENRLVFTTLEMACRFVQIRHDALFETMNDEYGAKLRVQSNMESLNEQVQLDMLLQIKEVEGALESDERNADVFNRISRVYRLLSTFMNTKFAQQMVKVPRVKGNIIKTNVLKKNPDYRKIEHLLEFLRGYDEIGYSVRVIEQVPQISEKFQRDIFHNIMFNYMVLKAYLENDSDRVVPGKPKEQQRTLKPRFIHEIIEELTEDYDLPDVEIRKVLIEELTKEQLMQEEAEERRRLIEERERRKKEEALRNRQLREAERERVRKEREAEQERIRQEKEAEKQRIFYERMVQEAEDRRRSGVFKACLEQFREKKGEQHEKRERAMLKIAGQKQDFADAAQIVEEAEQRKRDQLERQKQRRQEEKERLEREQLLQQKRIEKEKQRRQEEARLAEQRRLEEERLAEQRRLEAERLRQEQLEREEKERLEQLIAQDRQLLQGHILELSRFAEALEDRKKLREAYITEIKLDKERFEEEIRQKRAMKAAKGR